MENQQLPREAYQYDGTQQSNYEALKKRKGKAQSYILTYGLIIAFFLFTGTRAFISVTALESTYGNNIPDAELTSVFKQQIPYNIFKAVGKWGYLGLFIVISAIIYFFKLKGSMQTIKECNSLLEQADSKK